MEIRLGSVLLHRWNSAYGLLAPEGQRRLGSYLRLVRASTSVAGCRVKLADGSLGRVAEEGTYGVAFVPDHSMPLPGGIIIINAEYAQRGEVEAVAAFLYALAHAAFSMDGRPAAQGRPWDEAPTAAWLQAAAWGLNAQDRFSRPRALVDHLLRRANREARTWKASSPNILPAAVLQESHNRIPTERRG